MSINQNYSNLFSYGSFQSDQIKKSIIKPEQNQRTFTCYLSYMSLKIIDRLIINFYLLKRKENDTELFFPTPFTKRTLDVCGPSFRTEGVPLEQVIIKGSFKVDHKKFLKPFLFLSQGFQIFRACKRPFSHSFKTIG